METIKFNSFSEYFNALHFYEIILALYLGVISALDVFSCSYDLPSFYELRIADYIMFDAL